VLEIKLDSDTRSRIAREAREMGVLSGSLTGGKGNYVGVAGEVMAHYLLGGTRVGAERYSHDIELPNGLTVDVKTSKAASRPRPHYVARIYAPENHREKLATKCDVYYFMRAHESKHTVWALGWLFADEFVEKAAFLPMGSMGSSDGRPSFRDEFVLPLSALRDPKDPVRR
jgi:hypothetical protein